MLSEVVNALYITYLATEYNLLNSNSSSTGIRSRSTGSNGRRRSSQYPAAPHNESRSNSTGGIDDNHNGIGNTNQRIIFITIAVVIWNMFDYISGFGDLIHHFLDIIFLYHIPRIIFVASSYVITLYYDCYFAVQRQVQQQLQYVDGKSTGTKESVSSSVLTWKNFLPRIFRYFIRILPIYPIMAVLISFIFLFVISIFELLHISTDILNAPIYYGTLYGPFSYIYYHVKHDIITEQHQSTTSFLPHHHHRVHPTLTSTLT